MSATTTYVGVSTSPVVKRLYWASDATDGIWRGEGDVGRWRKPEDFGERSVLPPNKIIIEAHETPDLRSRFALRQKLAADANRFLLLGVGTPSPDRVSRNQKTLIDGKRAHLTCDVEKLILAEDVVDSDSLLPDLLAAKFEAAGLDWLNADCILHLSSSHGLLDRRELRAHIEWQPSAPLTIAEMKRVAAYINTRLGGPYVDVKIYESARLFFTGPASLLYRYWLDGKGFLTRDMPPLPVARVRYVDRDSPTIVIPPEALAGTPVAIPSLSRPKAKAIGKLGPGNVHNYMVKAVFAVVKGTAWHNLPAAKEELRHRLAAGVMALDDPEKLESRLATVSGTPFEASWAGALAKRYVWGDWHGRPEVRPDESGYLDVAAARATLASHIESAAREAYANSTLLPRHTLVTALPGLGKSQAAIEAITTARMAINRTVFLSPSVELSAELMRRHPMYGSANVYFAPLVRHHIGRDKVCTDKVYGPIGAQLGKIGRSPMVACERCPKLEACPWPAQHADKGAGLVFGQHAHATSSMRRTKAEAEGAPNFTIVDEALIGTLLSPNKMPRHIAALRRLNLKAGISGHIQGTADLRGYRHDALTALEAEAGPLVYDRISDWAQTVSVPARGDKPAYSVRVVDAAIDVEAWATSLYDKQIKAALADMAERRSRNLSDLSPRRHFQRAVRHIEASGFYAALYRAIRATIEVNKLGAQRTTVFGVHSTGKNGIASVHIRHDLPDAILRSHGLWLDGTPNPDIWLRFFGDTNFIPIEPLLKVRPPAAYHLTQYPDRPYGKTFWRAKPHLERLYRLILHRAAHYRGRSADDRVLVIVQQEVEQALRAMPLPQNVVIHHFKAIRGLDGLKAVPCAIVAGRPMLDRVALRALTEALHYDNPEVQAIQEAAGYTTTIRKLNTVRGHVEVNAECHPNAHAEALREQLVDKEVVQAIHRLRLFDRTADNPAEIHVLGQADTGLTVNQLCDWQDVERSPAEIMLASGVAATSPDLAARAAHGLMFGYASSTVRLVVESITKSADSLYKYIREKDERGVLIKGNRHISSCRWQLFTAKVEGLEYRRRVLVDVERWPDAAAAIEAELRVKVVSVSLVHSEVSEVAL